MSVSAFLEYGGGYPLLVIVKITLHLPVNASLGQTSMQFIYGDRRKTTWKK